MQRKLSSWLKGLQAYVEDTEASRDFWLWSGLFTISSALQRKVWLPFGIDTYYPNLYVLVIAPPANRKNLPIQVAKKLLQAIEIPICKDSGSKRNLTKELAETGKTETFQYKGSRVGQCAMSIISGEMSDLLAVNPKEVVEVLTSLYDCQDRWDYGTSGKGEDILYNVYLTCFIGTTPVWFAGNLPQEAIGQGYTSRNVIIYDDTVYKRVAIPELTDAQREIWVSLKHDLGIITRLVGEFEWEPEARKVFKKWYNTIDERIKNCPDERLHPFIGRMHAIAIKSAMCLQVEHSDELVLTPDGIGQSIDLLENSLQTASEAFGGHGRSRTGVDTNRVMSQLKTLRSSTLRELLSLNYRHLSRTELREVLYTIEGMGLISFEEEQILWMGKKGVKERL